MKTILRSEGLSCPSCVAKIEKALKMTQGVTDAQVHFSSGRIDVDHDENRVPVESLVQVIRGVGYEARPAAR